MLIIISLASLLAVLAAVLVWKRYRKRILNDTYADIDVMAWLFEHEEELKSRGCVEIHIIKGDEFLAYSESRKYSGNVVSMTLDKARAMKDSLILVACDAAGNVVGEPQMFDKSKSLYLLDHFNDKKVITISL